MKKFTKIVAVALCAAMLTACGQAAAPAAAPAAPAAEAPAAEAPAAEAPAAEAPAAEAPAYAEGEFQIQIGTVTNPGHCWVTTADWMVEQLKERSNGAIEATVFPGGQLGNDADMFSDLQLGTQAMLIGGLTNLEGYLPELRPLSMHYMWDNREELENAVKRGTPIFDYAAELYDAQDAVLLGLVNSGSRYLFAVKEVPDLATLKGMKMRVPNSQTENLVWSTLGALPTAMSFNDVYAAAQSNTVECFEVTLAAFNSSAMYEVAPYLMWTQHMYTMAEICYSKELWEQLPEDIQAIIVEVCDEAVDFCNHEADSADDNLADVLVKEHGMTIVEVDKAEFKAAIEPLYAQLVEESHSEKMYELVQEALAAASK